MQSYFDYNVKGLRERSFVIYRHRKNAINAHKAQISRWFNALTRSEEKLIWPYWFGGRVAMLATFAFPLETAVGLHSRIVCLAQICKWKIFSLQSCLSVCISTRNIWNYLRSNEQIHSTAIKAFCKCNLANNSATFNIYLAFNLLPLPRQFEIFQCKAADFGINHDKFLSAWASAVLCKFEKR